MLSFRRRGRVGRGDVVIAVISSDNQSQPGYTQLWMAPSKNAASANFGVDNQQGSTVVYRLQLLKKGRSVTPGI